jgi:hypothetical protein
MGENEQTQAGNRQSVEASLAQQAFVVLSARIAEDLKLDAADAEQGKAQIARVNAEIRKAFTDLVQSAREKAEKAAGK